MRSNAHFLVAGLPASRPHAGSCAGTLPARRSERAGSETENGNRRSTLVAAAGQSVPPSLPRSWGRYRPRSPPDRGFLDAWSREVAALPGYENRLGLRRLDASERNDPGTRVMVEVVPGRILWRRVNRGQQLRLGERPSPGDRHQSGRGRRRGSAHAEGARGAAVTAGGRGLQGAARGRRKSGVVRGSRWRRRRTLTRAARPPASPSSASSEPLALLASRTVRRLRLRCVRGVGAPRLLAECYFRGSGGGGTGVDRSSKQYI